MPLEPTIVFLSQGLLVESEPIFQWQSCALLKSYQLLQGVPQIRSFVTERRRGFDVEKFWFNNIHLTHLFQSNLNPNISSADNTMAKSLVKYPSTTCLPAKT